MPVFDPAEAFKATASATPSYSIRGKTQYGDWQNHFYEVFGQAQLIGDLARETDSVKQVAPKYSMRSRNATPVRAGPPGPGAYSIPAALADESPTVQHAPVWHFGSTDRDNAFNRVLAYAPKTPSPQDYDVSRDGAIGRVDQEALPAWSMRPRVQDQSEPEYRQSRSPRPGVHEYDVTHEHVDIAKTAAPKYSMRPKNAPQMKDYGPAPDAYETPSAVGGAHPSAPAAPQWQFGSTERDKAAGRAAAYVPETPSPQEYTVTRDGAIGRVDQEAPPTWSMRARTQDQADPEYRQSRSPRPSAHEYDIGHDHVDLVKSAAPKYSMRRKSPLRVRSESPAPGAYDCTEIVGNEHPVVSTNPSWQFGSAHRDNVVGRILSYVPKTPSPQEYSVSREGAIGRVDQESLPAWSMRRQTQDQSDPEYRESRSPRPSVHEYTLTHDHVDLRKSAAPKYSMRPKSPVPKRRDKSPGPGSYDVRGGIGRSASPMSRSTSTSAWGFGSAKRFQDKRPDTRVYTY